MLARENLLESLLELTDRTLSGSRQALLDRVLRVALPLTESEGAVMLTTHARVCERWGLVRGGSPQQFETARAGTDFTRTLMRAGQPIALPDVACDPRITHDDRCPGLAGGPALFVPMRQRDSSPAYLAMYRPPGAPRYSRDEVRKATLLTAWTGLAIENQRLSENVERLAVTDELTQVYNYRFLKTALKREIKRALRYGQELALVMIDVDSLKAYNDKNGHMRGSFLLKEIAGLFVEHLRSFDLVAKYGGDEFTLILPQTGREGALVVAERMREAVATHAFPLAEPGQITVSLGIALFPDDGADSLTLIQAADRALYQAKRRGRNRIEVVGRLAA